MLSSTSNSEAPTVAEAPVAVKLDRFTLALLVTVIAILAGAECVTVVGFDRVSKVQRREVAQRTALLRVRDSADQRTIHVAVVGNSLLLEGVNVPMLTKKIGPDVVPAPYFVLATGYYDWYFALKRLFSEGMAPRYVLLGLSPNQLASPRTRGDYSASYLFQSSDLFEVARDTHMDATTTSAFVLAHFSKYYSTRSVTRGFILNLALPSVAELLHNKLGTVRDPPLDEAVLAQLATERLAALDRLCRANGARFMLVVPPTYQPGAEAVAKIGNGLGIPSLVPVHAGEVDSTDYQADGFHLNEKGARFFTTRLASKLLDELRD
jgi:hypothetical protein